MPSQSLFVALVLLPLLLAASPLVSQTAPEAPGAAAAALRRQLAQYDRDAEAGKLEAMVSTFAEDIVLFTPGQPPIVGKPAARTVFKTLLEQFTVQSAVHEVGEITDVGEALVMHGRFRGTWLPKTGGPSVVADNWFVRIYKRRGVEALLLWRGAFGDNAPPPSSSK